MAIYGYIRVSTNHQKIERQLANIIRAYPELANHHERIFIDKFTGTSFDRPDWNRLCKIVISHAESGSYNERDRIVLDEVSRMGRTAEEGFNIYKDLFAKNIDLEFLKEHYIDTDSYREAMQGLVDIKFDTGDKATDDLVNGIMDKVNTFILRKIEKDIYRAFEQAEHEVTFLRQRIKEGIRERKAHGKQVGRQEGATVTTKKSIESKEKILKYNKAFNGSLTNEDTWKLIGISKGTFYKYKREIKADLLKELQ